MRSLLTSRVYYTRPSPTSPRIGTGCQELTWFQVECDLCSLEPVVAGKVLATRGDSAVAFRRWGTCQWQCCSALLFLSSLWTRWGSTARGPWESPRIVMGDEVLLVIAIFLTIKRLLYSRRGKLTIAFLSCWKKDTKFFRRSMFIENIFAIQMS